MSIKLLHQEITRFVEDGMQLNCLWESQRFDKRNMSKIVLDFIFWTEFAVTVYAVPQPWLGQQENLQSAFQSDPF